MIARRGPFFVAVGLIMAVAIGVLAHASWLPAGLLLLAVMLLVFGRRRAEALRELALTENRRLSARIDEFAIMQGRFVGNIAHEIKTPLAVVLGEAEVLQLRGGDAIAVQAIAESIVADVRHLADLVDSFLQLAHPLAQDETVEHGPVYLSDVVLAAVGRCSGMSTKHKVRLVTLLAPPDSGDPSAEVLGDAVLLEVMVENLLRNAVRFSSAGAQVTVRTTADRRSVGLMVQDHGVGIPIERQQAVFDWFFDGPLRPSGASGIGFGLSITKRIVDHHGGTIVLRDTPGGGCEFEITLARWWPEADEPAGEGCAPPVEPTATPASW
ncbi:MAG: sensor histidine kinase [Planctomycetota bacterium]